MRMRSILLLSALLLATLIPLGLADVAVPPPQGVRVPMRIVGNAASGYAELHIPRPVLESLMRGGGTRAADVAPLPVGGGNPVVQIAGGLLLSLGVLFLGERFFRRRNSKDDPHLKLLPIAFLLAGSLLLFTSRTTAQPRDSFSAGNLWQATQQELSGTVAVRVADSDQKAIVLLVGGQSSPGPRRPPLPSRK
jgi:membrane protein implicated in regulation of membrane protease activity